ncbi:D-alanyl-lipoteichoic acid biosynthesis protein DltB [Lacticaseibacillus saniviri]|uniref:Teichoic acid D-alanyltransferase n=1 Tax=Lacticaseibacillus saniviri JCM 17471 = DSM 24301 TaxID=1293598 RepID=A0A0R2MWS5_9LACO|nr:D-alanyl-lipoteichoic acid biosynthesis protein DltB [Lacticaseibacillus saniviri]KRO17959.1 D-alanyl transfer protein [Lacticaseibacillus saniviri JCM 17471 = DSM 24301]MCG4282528.1 D-alanyl-lipoteichoic acid biosynthesis protein DltB [Lacticaseibacillus saniviri]
MLNLQPYENPMYFVYLLIGLVPVIIGMFHGRRHRIYESIFSLFFLVLIFDADKWPQGKALILYIAYNTLLVWLYAKYRTKENSSNKTWVFYMAVILGIAPLTVVKFTPLFSTHPSLLGFLGISYLTFKVVGMIMELRDGAIKEVNFVRFLQFLLFFPTISSGPIDRYRRFLKDYDSAPTPEKYTELFSKAIHYLMLGFLYKFILGYLFGTLLYPHYEHLALLAHGNFLGLSWPLVGVMYSYSMYLFFDFAGYSLFAVAISYLMGVETPMNFNKPFISYNIKDFWNRWHMSLSFWFRDYIYMRFVFFMMKHKWVKSRVVTAAIGYFVLFGIMGIWHGETWYYIVYGLFHALLINLTDAWIRFKKKHKDSLPSNKFTYALSVFLTFNTVCFSFLIFSGFLDKLWFH